MNPFASLNKPAPTEVAPEKDVLGGGSFLFESDVYDLTILAAYAGVAKSGANSITFELQGEDKRKFKTVQYITSGTDKGCKTYYEKDGEKFNLAGFNIANAIAMMTTEKEIDAQEWEEKMIKVYNQAAGGEVPEKVMCAVSMHGKTIKLGIIKRSENKKVQNPSTKEWTPTNEVRETNEVDKVFHPVTGKTIAEYVNKTEGAEFLAKWLEKNKGVTQDRFKKVEGAAAAGAPGGAAGGTSAAPSSLFG